MAKNRQVLRDPAKAKEQAIVNLLTRNQRIAAEQATRYAGQAADKTLDMGQSAARGGLFMDTSNRPGFQNPVTGAFTGMLMRTADNEVSAVAKGIARLAQLRKRKQYQTALQGLDKSGSGGSGYASAIGNGGAAPEQTTTPQRIL